jgi:hypothetical protein
MSGAPKKSKSTKARTVQTGMMEGTDYVGKQNITPKKGVSDEEDYDEENVKEIEVDLPTEEETRIGSRQEQFMKSIKTAKGGKKRKSKRKTRKVKKHGKRRH